MVALESFIITAQPAVTRGEPIPSKDSVADTNQGETTQGRYRNKHSLKVKIEGKIAMKLSRNERVSDVGSGLTDLVSRICLRLRTFFPCSLLKVEEFFDAGPG